MIFNFQWTRAAARQIFVLDRPWNLRPHFEKNKIQSNLCATAPPGTQKYWPLLQVVDVQRYIYAKKSSKWDFQNVVVVGKWSLFFRRSLAQVWLCSTSRSIRCSLSVKGRLFIIIKWKNKEQISKIKIRIYLSCLACAYGER